jgi:hypothetical protein
MTSSDSSKEESIAHSDWIIWVAGHMDLSGQRVTDPSDSLKSNQTASPERPARHAIDTAGQES